MKHALCHLHDDMIRTLCHSVVFKPIRGEYSLFNAMIFQKLLECLGNVLPTIVRPFVLILCSNCIFTSTLNSLNLSKHSLLDFNIYNHAFLEKSSMKVIVYLALPIDVVLIELHTSEFTISKGLVVRLPFLLKNAILCCFLSMYIVRNNEDVG